ncbi:hypothetical protein FBUS_06380, partial [Fasciolopsis buskii]
TLVRHSVSVEAFPLIAITASSASRQNAGRGREALQWVMKYRLPLLPSYPNWNVHLSQTSTNEDSTQPNGSEPLIFDVLNPTQLNTSTFQSPKSSWKDRLWATLRRRNSFPTVWAEQQSFAQDIASTGSALLGRNENGPVSETIASDLDGSPISRLGTHIDSISRDVTAMSNALVRRCQRVARLFSRIDEYVVIM